MTMRSRLSIVRGLVIATLAATLAILPRADAAQEVPCKVCNITEQTTHNASPDPCYGSSSFVTSNKVTGVCTVGCPASPCLYDIVVNVSAQTGQNCGVLEIRQNGNLLTSCTNCSSLGWQGSPLQILCQSTNDNVDTYLTNAGPVGFLLTGAQHDVTCKKCQ